MVDEAALVRAEFGDQQVEPIRAWLSQQAIDNMAERIDAGGKPAFRKAS